MLSNLRQLMDNVLENTESRHSFLLFSKKLEERYGLHLATKVMAAYTLYEKRDEFPYFLDFFESRCHMGTKWGFNAIADVLMKYSNRQVYGLESSIYSVGATDELPANNWAERMCSKELLETLDIFRGCKSENVIIGRFGKIAGNDSERALDEKINIVRSRTVKESLLNYDVEEGNAIMKAVAYYPTDIAVLNVVRIFEKYPQISKDIAAIINQKKLHDLNIPELSIREVPLHNVKKVLVTGYSRFREQINDNELYDNISYDDLDKYMEVYDLLQNIHSKRNHKQITKIEWSYKDEMNRAVSQGSDLKSKIRYFRQYCREVKEQLKENASELMYEHA